MTFAAAKNLNEENETKETWNIPVLQESSCYTYLVAKPIGNHHSKQTRRAGPRSIVLLKQTIPTQYNDIRVI